MENLDNVLFYEMTEKQKEIFEKNWIQQCADGIVENCEWTLEDALERAIIDYERWLDYEGAIARDEAIKWNRENGKEI